MRARKVVWAALLAATVLGTGSSWAVSDGDYDPEKQGCSGGALDSDRPDNVEEGCNTVMLRLSDGSHTYFSVGVPATPSGQEPSSVVVCVALAKVNHCALVDRAGFHPLPAQPTNAAHPGKGGLHLYFGADDNLDNGEHDGSEYVRNGPSDGGAIQANVEPGRAWGWLRSLEARDKHYLLTHPLPMANTGLGACADGICVSVQTQRRVAYKGGDPSKSQSVSNYEGKEWDPDSCGGPDDQAEDCGGRNLGEWHADNGTSYAEPGLQIYEDPDPQGSPLGPYPLPAVYVGTCGVVIGGGDVQVPPSRFTNSAGQFVVETGC